MKNPVESFSSRLNLNDDSGPEEKLDVLWEESNILRCANGI
jgi:hypothetical protein